MAYLTKDDTIPTKGKGSRISHKMKRFCEEYMIDLNRNEAIVRAGYKVLPHNAPKVAAELMNHPHVITYLDELWEERREKTKVDADYVLGKLISIVENTEVGNPQAALRGLELIGKHLGMYKEKQEISGPDGEAIKYEKVREDASDFTSAIASLAKRSGEGGLAAVPNTGTEG